MVIRFQIWVINENDNEKTYRGFNRFVSSGSLFQIHIPSRKRGSLFQAAIFDAFWQKFEKIDLFVVEKFTRKGNVWNLQGILVPIIVWSKLRLNI